MPASLRLPFWVAVVCATAAAAGYAATFFDLAVLQLLMLVPLLFFVWPLALWRWRRVPRRNLVSEIFGDVPRWLKAATAALLLFAFANAFACWLLNDRARPHLYADGRAALVRGPVVVRTLTPAEYRHARAVQMRMLTGTLAPCFALAAVLLEVCWIKNGPAMADRDIS